MYLIKWVFEESSNCFGNKKADLIKSQNRCRFQINKKGFASSLECKRIINILAKIRIRQAMQVVVAVVNAASSSSFFCWKLVNCEIEIELLARKQQKWKQDRTYYVVSMYIDRAIWCGYLNTYYYWPYTTQSCCNSIELMTHKDQSWRTKQSCWDYFIKMSLQARKILLNFWDFTRIIFSWKKGFKENTLCKVHLTRKKPLWPTASD